MKLERNRNLRKIVLAMAVAGYCAIPAIASAAWTSVTENTGNINGTVPWIQDTSTTPVDHHVSISAKRDGKKSTEQLAVGDEVTVLWVLADAEGDTDANNELTKATIKWLRNGQEISGVTAKPIHSPVRMRVKTLVSKLPLPQRLVFLLWVLS